MGFYLDSIFIFAKLRLRQLTSIHVFTGLLLPLATQANDLPNCSQSKVREVLEPASASQSTVILDCHLKLSANDHVTKQIIIEGQSISGLNFDCGQAQIRKNDFSFADKSNPTDSIIIRTRRILDQSTGSITGWSRPARVSVSNCIMKGTTIRIYGMGENAGKAEVRESSRRDLNHTQRAQTTAPTEITLDHLDFLVEGARIPIYVGPGVTHSNILNSHFNGSTNSSVIYLEAESEQNNISGNTFDVQPNQEISFKTKREIIAIDGSAENLIKGNIFLKQKFSAIKIYRNCGEEGTIRHLKPSGNQIVNNLFYQNRAASIHVGTRQGTGIGSYCSHDSGKPFGSSQSDLDWAENTNIEGNTFRINLDSKNTLDRYIVVTTYNSTKLKNNKVQLVTLSSRLDFGYRIFGEFKNLGGNSIQRLPEATQINFNSQGKFCNPLLRFSQWVCRQSPFNANSAELGYGWTPQAVLTNQACWHRTTAEYCPSSMKTGDHIIQSLITQKTGCDLNLKKLIRRCFLHALPGYSQPQVPSNQWTKVDPTPYGTLACFELSTTQSCL
jgi:hypothetical protein